ncbi:MAG: ATP-binding protein [Proteobacteria bacterium]|nr:ATP-binding protein [Pseudomonadota bacterium]
MRANEAQLRLITDTLPARIIYFDREQKFRFVNKLVEQHEGRPASAILGRTAEEIIGNDRYRTTRGYIEEALAGKAIVRTWRGPFGDKIADLRATFVPDVSENGEVLGTIMFLEDVSEAKALGEQLRQAQKMEAIVQLTGGVAHDFNNLIMVIQGNLELLDAQLDDEVLRKRVEVASRAVKRGADLTAKLLSFARRRVLRPERVDLNTTLAQHGDLLQRTLGDAIEVELRLADSPCFAEVDVGELQTAILNLAINARDAMPRGGQLVVSVEAVNLHGNVPVFGADAPHGRFIKFEVSDTGTGINAEVLARLFEPFFTTKEVGKGTGLGLSQVYGLVTQSEGYLAVDSPGGRGTRVAIYLPAAGAEVEDLTGHDVQTDTAPGGGEVILVVEDNDEVRDVSVGMLSILGYQIIPARDGNDALELLKGGQDIVLLFTDVVMPGGA